MSKFGPDPAQIASHADHIVARHVLGGMPQRADTSLVRGDHAQTPRAQLPAPLRRVLLPSRVDGELPTPPWRPHSHSLALYCALLRERRRVHHGRRAELDAVPILAVPRLLAPSEHHHELRLYLLCLVLALAISVRR